MFAGHGSDTSTTTEEALKLIRRSLKSNSMDRVEGTHFDGSYPHVFVTFGASVSGSNPRDFNFFSINRSVV